MTLVGRNVLDTSTITGDSEADRGSAELCTGVRILFHPESGRIGDVAPLFDRGAEGTAQLSRLEPRFRDCNGRDTGPLSSAHVSRAAIQVIQERDGSIRIDPCNTKVTHGLSRIHAVSRIPAEEATRGVVIGLGDHVVLWLGKIRPSAPTEQAGLIGSSEPIQRIREDILRVSGLEVSVLLRGETGVGKELVARAIHDNGARARGPYVPVNLAAIPASTAVSQLFGHSRGAFTGATSDRRGYFSEAHGGTLFLDEIGDTPDEIQPMLLRALELGQIQPVGGAVCSVDVRVVAATDSNLEAAIASGHFRWPLLRRFDYQIRIPPLRERREDIGLLFRHFLRRELDHLGESARLATPEPDRQLWMPARLGLRLACHSWTGNVRELRNLVKRFAIHNRGRERVQLDEEIQRSLEDGEPDQHVVSAWVPTAPPNAISEACESRRDLDQIPDERIAEAWRAARYRAKDAAAELGVGVTYFLKRLETCAGVVLAKNLGAEEILGTWDALGGDLPAVARRLGVSKRALQLQITRLRLTLPGVSGNESSDEDGD